MTFPVDQREPRSRCILAEVLDHPSDSGVIGLNQTPIGGVGLYTYLFLITEQPQRILQEAAGLPETTPNDDNPSLRSYEPMSPDLIPPLHRNDYVA